MRARSPHRAWRGGGRALDGLHLPLALCVLLERCEVIPPTPAVAMAFMIGGVAVAQHRRRGLPIRMLGGACLARLYPVHVLSLLLLLAVQSVEGLDLLAGLGSVAASLFLVQGWVPALSDGAHGAAWFSSSLWFCCLVFLTLAATWARMRSRASLLACTAACWGTGMALAGWSLHHAGTCGLPALDPWLAWVRWGPPCHLLAFLAGAALAALREHEEACCRTHDGTAWSILAAAGLLALLVGVPSLPPVMVQGPLLLPLVAALVWGLLWVRWPERPVMAGLGEAGYAAWLLQEPLGQAWFERLGQPGWHGHGLAAVLPLALLLVAVGGMVHRWGERPVLRWALRAMRQRRAFFCVERTPWREGLGGLGVAVALLGYAMILPHRVAMFSTRIDEAVARVGMREVAWDVAGGDERFLRAYHERLPGVRFVAFDHRRGGPPPCFLLVGRRAWEQDTGLGAALLEVEPDADVALWAMPQLGLQQVSRIPPLGTMLGVEPDPRVPERGLHAPERDGRGRRWRWTNGRARLEVALGARPSSLELVLHSSRRTRLEVRVDRHTAWRGVLGVVGTRSWRIPLQPAQLGATSCIELWSDSFVPSQESPGSRDVRRLGVALMGVRLLP